jgi:hypothetical protein
MSLLQMSVMMMPPMPHHDIKKAEKAEKGGKGEVLDAGVEAEVE